MNHEAEFIVHFMMWGQACTTVFGSTSEKTPQDWLSLLEDKGWLLPVEIVKDGVVVWSREAEGWGYAEKCSCGTDSV